MWWPQRTFRVRSVKHRFTSICEFHMCCRRPCIAHLKHAYDGRTALEQPVCNARAAAGHPEDPWRNSPLRDPAELWNRILFEEACSSAIEAIQRMPRLKTLHLEPIAEDSMCPEALFTLGKEIEELCILGRRYCRPCL